MDNGRQDDPKESDASECEADAEREIDSLEIVEVFPKRDQNKSDRKVTIDTSGLEIIWPEEGTDEWYDFDVDVRTGELLGFSRRLDVHRWSEYPEVNDFINRVYDEHLVQKNTNAKIRKKHLKVVLLDLYVAWCESPDLKISMSRSPNDYSAGSVYNELSISRTTIDVVDALVPAGLICEKRGFYDRETATGRQTRIWPTALLVEMFREAKFSTFDISYSEDRLPVCLRDVEKNDQEFDVEASGLEPQIEQLKAYNKLLRETFIAIPDLGDPVVETGDASQVSSQYLIVSQANKFVRRVYNRGSFELGGRFTGGWWHNCPKHLRDRIYIDDHHTVEIDYSSLHPTMMYAEEGIDYWHDIGRDPYELGALSFQKDPQQLRDLAKSLMLILINAKSREEVPNAIRHGARAGSWLKHLTNSQVNEAIDTVSNLHQPIAHRFHSDDGLRLQYLDSEITSKILDYFLAQDEPILTIHDSYIVRDGWHEDLELIMQSAFMDVVGVNVATQLKYAGMTSEDITNELMARYDFRQGVGTDQQEQEDLTLYRQTNPVRTDRYVRDLQFFTEWKESRQ
ncbi:MAG: hypothetical protein AAFY80_10160 [Pseudomonadota bacterium]